MALSIARIAVNVFFAWTAIGVLFALAFTTVGVERVDSEARSGSIIFRTLIFPACVALWPLLLIRWLRGNGEAPRERSAHRLAAREPRP